MTAMLEIDNLTLEFETPAGRVHALDNVGLSVDRGGCVALVGESGSGKSITGMAIMRLNGPNARIRASRIALDGTDMQGLTDKAFQTIRGRRVAMIFQNAKSALNPLRKVGDTLTDILRAHAPERLSKREARARVLAMLEKIGIREAEDRMYASPAELSGGMCQRIMIAAALLCEPELIIADEPTTALDVSIQAQITALLKRLCRERGTAVMLVTHDMGVIAETADRVAVMYAGRLAEVGAVEDVVRRPRHPYTAGLMGSIPSLRSDVEELQMIPGAMPRLDAIPPGCAFNPRCAHAGPKCRRDIPRVEGTQAVACWLATEGAVA